MKILLSWNLVQLGIGMKEEWRRRGRERKKPDKENLVSAPNHRFFKMVHLSTCYLLILALFSSLVSAESTAYTLFHRIIDPSSTSKPNTISWSPRAILEFDPSNPIPSYQPTTQDALASLLESSKDSNDETSFYQLLLVKGSKKLGGMFDEDVKKENGIMTSLRKVSIEVSDSLLDQILLMGNYSWRKKWKDWRSQVERISMHASSWLLDRETCWTTLCIESSFFPIDSNSYLPISIEPERRDSISRARYWSETSQSSFSILSSVISLLPTPYQSLSPSTFPLRSLRNLTL